jgi:hypothetical protein
VCWGDNGSGQLGDGTNVARTSPVAVAVPAGVTLPFTSVFAGYAHTCAVDSASGLWCWGSNASGELGDGTQLARNVPTRVKIGTEGVTIPASSYAARLGLGLAHSCGYIASATTPASEYCWGDNTYGQLGNNSTALRSTSPVKVATPPGMYVPGSERGTAAGRYHTCAIDGLDGIQCWGRNDAGQLGTATTTNRTMADRSPQLNGFSRSWLFAGGDQTCVRETAWGSASRRVVCVGSNTSGQAGDGTTTTPKLTATAPTGSEVVTASANVLINRFTSASGQVGGHVMPVPFSMSTYTTWLTNASGTLFVTYDPLAAAAAMFIEQYDAHLAACNNTTTEAMTEADELAGLKLWACSNPTAKTNYTTGMLTLLNGARHYLFGSDTGCVQSTETVNGQSCAATVTGPDPVHYPYTLWVPPYTTVDNNGDPTVTTGPNAYWYPQLSAALDVYRTSLATSTAKRLEKTLQLVGIAPFTTNNALVTTDVSRQGSYGNSCVLNDGFDALPGAASTTTTTTTTTCTPTTCSAQGKNCGSVADGCGGTLTCGTCTAPLTCGGGATANVCGAPLLGSATMGTISDNMPKGQAESFRVYATTTGTITSLSVYLDANTTPIVLGLYANTGTQPGALLGQATVAAPVAGWNTVTLPAISVSAGVPYWVTVLGKSGIPNFRTSADAAGVSYGSASTTLTALPATWTSGPMWTGATISASGK